uniref:Uncharacterized protein n=1 Tax=Rhizophora mucronata TaxID=61149 RepID=A0A2P2J604_RHIMU
MVRGFLQMGTNLKKKKWDPAHQRTEIAALAASAIGPNRLLKKGKHQRHHCHQKG